MSQTQVIMHWSVTSSNRPNTVRERADCGARKGVEEVSRLGESEVMLKADDFALPEIHMVTRVKDIPKFLAAIYFMDTVYTPVGLLKNPTSLLTMTDEGMEKEFRKEVVPIVEKSLGKVESMKLVQKLEGSGWAMVGFQMDGRGFSAEPRIFVYDSRDSFESVLTKSYETEKA